MQVYLYSVLLHDQNPKIKVTSIKRGFIDIRVIFQNCCIWAWDLVITKSSRSCTYTLFLFNVVQIKINFRSSDSSFQDTGPFSKLPNLAIKLGHCSKLHIHTLFTSGVNIELIFALQAAVAEILAEFQNCHVCA